MVRKRRATEAAVAEFRGPAWALLIGNIVGAYLHDYELADLLENLFITAMPLIGFGVAYRSGLLRSTKENDE